MKKLILTTVMLVFTLTAVMAQKPAQIKFEKTTHDFGSFSESSPKVTCVFTYTNVGEQPLIVKQALACNREKTKRTGGIVLSSCHKSVCCL